MGVLSTGAPFGDPRINSPTPPKENHVLGSVSILCIVIIIVCLNVASVSYIFVFGGPCFVCVSSSSAQGSVLTSVHPLYFLGLRLYLSSCALCVWGSGCVAMALFPYLCLCRMVG